MRRASGDLPPKLERELDELFLAHSPVAGRGGDLGEAMRMVDAVTFIDPVVPVESERAAGAFVKKGMRSLLLWYVGWVTHQMSQSAAAVSRALHIVDDRLQELERQVEVQRVPAAGVVEFPALHGSGRLVGRARRWPPSPRSRGRVLHAACGDGWLVRRIVDAGGDAYGVDPRARARRRGRARRARPARRDRGGAPACGGRGRPGRRRAERHGGGDGRRRARPAPAALSRPAGTGRDARHALGDANRPGRRPTRRPRPTSLPGGRCGPRRGAGSWSRAGTRPCARPGPGGADYLVTAVRAAVATPRRAHAAVSAAAGRPVAVHQFIPTLNPHDATGTHTLKLRDALRRAGWRSEIFAEAIHDDLAAAAYKHWMYPEHAAEGDVAIYQFTTSSAVAGYLAEHGLPLILDFHNFTGPEYFAGWEPRQRAARAARAAEELDLLAPAGACSAWPRAASASGELRRAGCRRTAVVPVLADYGRVTATPDPRVAAELARCGAGGGADILFVGRIVPSKAQHELVKALWAYRRLYDDRGPPAPRRWHVELRVQQGAAGVRRRPRPGGPPSASPARCPTRRSPPTSPPPTSISRCRRTRGSVSRWWRPWWPASPS